MNNYASIICRRTSDCRCLFFLLIRPELENKVKFCYDNNTLVILLVSDSNNSIMKVSGGDTFWKWNISMII
ncbi:hypothetical protein TOTSKI_13440 [Facklamia hominis]